MHSHRSIQTILSLLVAITASSACEKRGTDAPAGNAAGNGLGATAPKPTSDLPAEPVSRDPNANKTIPQQPSPDPAPAAGAVRPPVAADLAEYTKDVKGNGGLQATIETSMGTFHCELYGDKTPATVANFVGLATGKKPWMNPKTSNVERNKPYFDGLTFHRVIPEFMIQGGDPLGQGIGGPGYQFNDEIVPELKMAPGVLAMANSGPAPDGGGTNGSQFFITEIAPDWLNGKHTIFGKCKEVDLVKQIARVKLAGEKPATPVTINKVTICKS